MQEIQELLGSYSTDIQKLFYRIRDLIFRNIDENIEEKLWAKLPSYYLGNRFIRIIPFKDHINIEAKAILDYAGQLDNYKVTPKGMLKIYLKQELPESILVPIFKSTLLIEG